MTEIDLRKKKYTLLGLNQKIERKIKKLFSKLKEKKLTISTFESCTGGCLVNELTNIPGASEFVKGGIVAYWTEIKIKFGISKKIIEKHSVYSKEVALSMAKKAREKFKTEIGVGITGTLSRKDPQYPEKEVGVIFIGISFLKNNLTLKLLLSEKKRNLAKKIIIDQILDILLLNL